VSRFIHSALAGDQSYQILFASRDLTIFSLHLLKDGASVYTEEGKLVWRGGESREKVFDMYGDSHDNLLGILAVVLV